MVTHLEPDILEFISSEHYKAGGGDGIPGELFKILKDDVFEVIHSICQKIWKTQKWPQDWKISVFILHLYPIVFQ